MASTDLLEKKSKVINIIAVSSGFKNAFMPGDTTIKPGSFTYLQNMEIDKQFRDGNICFAGTDGLGNHAHFYIDSEEMRKSLFGKDKDGKAEKRLWITDEVCAEIIKTKSLDSFKKKLEEHVTTLVEKEKLIAYCKKQKMTDYNKMKTMSEVLQMPFASISKALTPTE